MAALRPVLALFGLSEQNVKLPVPSCVSSGPLTVTRKSGPWLVRALRGDLSSLGKRGLADGTCSRSAHHAMPPAAWQSSSRVSGQQIRCWCHLTVTHTAGLRAFNIYPAGETLGHKKSPCSHLGLRCHVRPVHQVVCGVPTRDPDVVVIRRTPAETCSGSQCAARTSGEGRMSRRAAVAVEMSCERLTDCCPSGLLS